ncbi:homocysteine S-methyltransferase [Prauserella alba]|uniref:Homocysteine S-methyltransferase n=1 Tax=Prauserella alba TaxID=176898 RepID=A0ABN1V2F7_9PSEU|nr:homocysteine S-methyltransferase [Prauserella alba]MCP2180418.1 homocysteine S-methyltransferase (EC 2.1.1.10) [Prauserella alba]
MDETGDAGGDPVVVLDGGLATELEARGHDLSGSLWSASMLADAPEEVVAAHEAFFRAGATVAITASYQASVPGFAAHGLSESETRRLLRRSVDLARQASDRAGGGRVAASVGPYGAYLADGSEYRGRYGLTTRELTAFHRPRVATLAEAGPDLIALETVPDVDEAVALLTALDAVDVPAWLSYTVAGGRTRAGQSLEEAFAVAAGDDRVVGVGVNCCAPDEVVHAVEVARAITGKPVVAYPNSGHGWDASARQWTGRATFSPEQVRHWIRAGARFVGGCCRVCPAEIAEIARIVREYETSPDRGH